MAAINVSVAQAEIIGQVAAVVATGLAILMVYAALLAFRHFREVLGDGGASASPAREKPTSMEQVYERAAAMAASGQGQSDVYGHNLATEAYDSGYVGRRMGDVVDPVAMKAYQDGQAARAEDRA
jgi:hypothetical protein